MTCKPTHVPSCEDGWVAGDTIVVGRGEMQRKYPTLAPCIVCRPGQYAVWKMGMLGSRWSSDERAVRAYVRATVEAGAKLPPEAPQPTAVWNRVMREFAGIA